MNILNEILITVGRIEGRMDEIGKLHQRVSRLEMWQAWLKGAWAALAAALAYIYRTICSGIASLKVFRLVAILSLFLSLSACVSAHYTLHPGALNTTDSAAYDALLIAEAAIDQARSHYKAGQLPPKAKDALDILVRSYNIARESWLTYRNAISANLPDETYVDQLMKNFSNLTDAIRVLKEAK
jgi:hypothetical protein